MARPGPPYLRIVDDIRRRIESGELRPGDLVPSARRITQEWGVAIATATKVLAALQQEGLVKAVPGVGTVVATGTATGPATESATRSAAGPAAGPRAGEPSPMVGRRRPAGDHEQELTRERIVRTAIEIADAEGMAELSMRRIATELGVATMSLYRHVRNKDDLVFFMIDAAIGEEVLPAIAPEGWRARFELSSRLQWTGFRRHPWLARAMSVTRPQLAPNALRYLEWALGALEGFDLGPSDQMHVHLLLFSFVRGLAMSLESEAEAEQDSGMTSDEWMEAQEDQLAALATSDAVRTFLWTAQNSNFDLDLDTLFEFGLTRILDGLEPYLRALSAAA
jgi:AcrR family transcriptional regulator